MNKKDVTIKIKKPRKYENLEYEIFEYRKLNFNETNEEFKIQSMNTWLFIRNSLDFEKFNKSLIHVIEYCDFYNPNRPEISLKKISCSKYNKCVKKVKDEILKSSDDISQNLAIYIIYVDKLENEVKFWNIYSSVIPFYIGKTKNTVEERFQQHLWKIRKSYYEIHENGLTHYNRKNAPDTFHTKIASFLLSNDLNLKNIKIRVLKKCSDLSDLDSSENAYIDNLKAYKFGFNQSFFISEFAKIKKQYIISTKYGTNFDKKIFESFLSASKKYWLPANVRKLIGFGYFKINIYSILKILESIKLIIENEYIKKQVEQTILKIHKSIQIDHFQLCPMLVFGGERSSSIMWQEIDSKFGVKKLY